MNNCTGHPHQQKGSFYKLASQIAPLHVLKHLTTVQKGTLTLPVHTIPFLDSWVGPERMKLCLPPKPNIPGLG